MLYPWQMSYSHRRKKQYKPWDGDQNTFLESMAEAAKSIVNYAGSENFIYINVINRLSCGLRL